MIHDLYNVRELPDQNGPTPLSAEEEQRCRAVFLTQIAADIAEKGWARFPAYTTEERIRLRAIAQTLSERWGRTVTVEADGLSRMFFSLESLDAPAAPNDGALSPPRP